MTDFPKKLGEWIEEEKEVEMMVPILDAKGRVSGMEKQKQVVKQKVQYSQAIDQKIDCGTRKHYWTIPDSHVHTAFCRDCKKRRFIRAVYEKVVDGKFLNRDTGQHID